MCYGWIAASRGVIACSVMRELRCGGIARLSPGTRGLLIRAAWKRLPLAFGTAVRTVAAVGPDSAVWKTRPVKERASRA